MSSEFDSDLQELRHELSASRAEFLGALQSLIIQIWTAPDVVVGPLRAYSST